MSCGTWVNGLPHTDASTAGEKGRNDLKNCQFYACILSKVHSEEEALRGVAHHAMLLHNCMAFTCYHATLVWARVHKILCSFKGAAVHGTKHLYFNVSKCFQEAERKLCSSTPWRPPSSQTFGVTPPWNGGDGILDALEVCKTHNYNQHAAYLGQNLTCSRQTP